MNESHSCVRCFQYTVGSKERVRPQQKHNQEIQENETSVWDNIHYRSLRGTVTECYLLTAIRGFLCAQDYAKHFFPCTVQHSPHTNPVRQVLLTSSYIRWLKGVNNLLRVTHLVMGLRLTLARAHTPLLPVLPDSSLISGYAPQSSCRTKLHRLSSNQIA